MSQASASKEETYESQRGSKEKDRQVRNYNLTDLKNNYRANKQANAVLVNGKEINDMETDELINYINGKPKNIYSKNLNKKKKKKMKGKNKNQGEFSLIGQDNSRLLEAIGHQLDHYEESTSDSITNMSNSSYGTDHEQSDPKIKDYIEKEINEIDVNEFNKRIQSVHDESKSKFFCKLAIVNSNTDNIMRSKSKAKQKLKPNISQEWVDSLRLKLDTLIL